MAEYRTLRMTFWNDPYVEELGPQGRLLYLYLITGPYTNNLGVLEVSVRRMAYETGLAQDEVERLLDEAEKAGKLVRDGSVIWVANFVKHQASTSPRLVQSLRTLYLRLSSAKIRAAAERRYPELFGLRERTPRGAGASGHPEVSGVPEDRGAPRAPEAPGIPGASAESGASTESGASAEFGASAGAGASTGSAEGMGTVRAPGRRVGEGCAEGEEEGEEKAEGKRARFRAPSTEEVRAYCRLRGNEVSAEEFVDFYASKGWTVGSAPMRDWRAAVRTWEARRRLMPRPPGLSGRERRNEQAIRRAVERFEGAAASRREET